MQEQGLPLKEAVFCFFVSIATILGTGVVEGTRKWSGQRKKFPSAPGIFSACVLCFSFLSPTSLLLCRHLGPASEAVRMWLWSFCGDLSICAVGSGTRAGDCQRARLMQTRMPCSQAFLEHTGIHAPTHPHTHT